MAELPQLYDVPAWARYALALLRWSGTRGDLIYSPRFSDTAATLTRLRQSKIDSLHYLAVEQDSIEQSVYQKVWLTQRDALAEFCAEFSRLCDCPVILKGADSVDRYFGSNAIALMNDCDVLVKRSDLVSAKIASAKLGYRPAIFDVQSGKLVDRDIADISSIENRHYELVAQCRLEPLDLDRAELEFACALDTYPLRVVNGRAYVVTELDIHHSIAIDVDPTRLLDEARAGTLSHTRALTAEDNLWFLLGRYYTEVAVHGKRTLRDLAHVAVLLCQEILQWSTFIERVHENEVEAAVFYLLSFFRALLGPTVVPQYVINQLSPTKIDRTRDWGWQLGKLFGFVEPMPKMLELDY